jgi:hypothetical protein
MMIKAKGPVWHKKQKEKGEIPKNLKGIDKQATWSKSRSDGWVYGHGSFSIVSHKECVLGCFLWMLNSGHEAKRMYQEAQHYQGLLSHLVMDSKADDQKLFRNLKDNYQIRLVTACCKEKNKTTGRRQMIAAMQTKKCQKYLKERSHTVEPMQGLVKEIFDLDRCWMRKDDNNRWLFAAMGLAVQMHQLQAYRKHKSTWKIKSAVWGEP